jgi:hypothetical protein
VAEEKDQERLSMKTDEWVRDLGKQVEARWKELCREEAEKGLTAIPCALCRLLIPSL